MSETLDIPYNLRGNKDEAILDAMKEIESLQKAHKKEILAFQQAIRDEYGKREALEQEIEYLREELISMEVEAADWFKDK